MNRVPQNCYSCGTLHHTEGDSVLLRCECPIFYCQNCAREQLQNFEKTYHKKSEIGVTCPRCHMRITASFIRKHKDAIDEVSKSEAQLIKSVSETMGMQRKFQSVNICYEALEYFRTLGPWFEKFCATKKYTTAEQYRLLLARLEFARIEFIRINNNSSNDPLFVNEIDFGDIPCDSSGLPFGPLAHISFYSNLYLENLWNGMTREVQFECGVCFEPLTESLSVLYPCECFVSYCKSCEIRAVGSRPSTFSAGVSCMICKASSGFIENLEDMKSVEAELVLQAQVFWNTSSKRCSNKPSSETLRRLLAHYETLGFLEVDENERYYESLDMLKLELARVQTRCNSLLDHFYFTKDTPATEIVEELNRFDLNGVLPLGPLEIYQTSRNIFLEATLKILNNEDVSDLLPFPLLKSEALVSDSKSSIVISSFPAILPISTVASSSSFSRIENNSKFNHLTDAEGLDIYNHYEDSYSRLRLIDDYSISHSASSFDEFLANFICGKATGVLISHKRGVTSKSITFNFSEWMIYIGPTRKFRFKSDEDARLIDRGNFLLIENESEGESEDISGNLNTYYQLLIANSEFSEFEQELISFSNFYVSFVLKARDISSSSIIGTIIIYACQVSFEEILTMIDYLQPLNLHYLKALNYLLKSSGEFRATCKLMISIEERILELSALTPIVTKSIVEVQADDILEAKIGVIDGLQILKSEAMEAMDSENTYEAAQSEVSINSDLVDLTSVTPTSQILSSFSEHQNNIEENSSTNIEIHEIKPSNFSELSFSCASDLDLLVSRDLRKYGPFAMYLKANRKLVDSSSNEIENKSMRFIFHSKVIPSHAFRHSEIDLQSEFCQSITGANMFFLTIPNLNMTILQLKYLLLRQNKIHVNANEYFYINGEIIDANKPLHTLNIDVAYPIIICPIDEIDAKLVFKMKEGDFNTYLDRWFPSSEAYIIESSVKDDYDSGYLSNTSIECLQDENKSDLYISQNQATVADVAIVTPPAPIIPSVNPIVISIDNDVKTNLQDVSNAFRIYNFTSRTRFEVYVENKKTPKGFHPSFLLVNKKADSKGALRMQLSSKPFQNIELIASAQLRMIGGNSTLKNLRTAIRQQYPMIQTIATFKSAYDNQVLNENLKLINFEIENDSYIFICPVSESVKKDMSRKMFQDLSMIHNDENFNENNQIKIMEDSLVHNNKIDLSEEDPDKSKTNNVFDLTLLSRSANPINLVEVELYSVQEDEEVSHKSIAIESKDFKDSIANECIQSIIDNIVEEQVVSDSNNALDALDEANKILEHIADIQKTTKAIVEFPISDSLSSMTTKSIRQAFDEAGFHKKIPFNVYVINELFPSDYAATYSDSYKGVRSASGDVYLELHLSSSAYPNIKSIASGRLNLVSMNHKLKILKTSICQQFLPLISIRNFYSFQSDTILSEAFKLKDYNIQNHSKIFLCPIEGWEKIQNPSSNSNPTLLKKILTEGYKSDPALAQIAPQFLVDESDNDILNPYDFKNKCYSYGISEKTPMSIFIDTNTTLTKSSEVAISSDSLKSFKLVLCINSRALQVEEAAMNITIPSLDSTLDELHRNICRQVGISFSRIEYRLENGTIMNYKNTLGFYNICEGNTFQLCPRNWNESNHSATNKEVPEKIDLTSNLEIGDSVSDYASISVIGMKRNLEDGEEWVSDILLKVMKEEGVSQFKTITNFADSDHMSVDSSIGENSDHEDSEELVICEEDLLGYYYSKLDIGLSCKNDACQLLHRLRRSGFNSLGWSSFSRGDIIDAVKDIAPPEILKLIEQDDSLLDDYEILV